jgi:hypothetical protein
MKQMIVLFAALILLTTANVLAQTASDYYTPLSIGNHVTLHTVSLGTNSTWAYRTTSYTIEGTDSIFGRQYFRERAFDVIDGTDDTVVFRNFWLRKDSVGNVALGAMNVSNESSDIDSATIVNAGSWFPNGYLTIGYSVSNPWGNLVIQDSVLSVNETVNATAGTFSNCIEIMESQINDSGTVVFREYQYYAFGVGMVKNVRTLPANEANTGELIAYGITGIRNTTLNQMPREFSLAQNYPNPFNPTTKITFTLVEDSHVSLKVFDMLGREVANLVNQDLRAGIVHSAVFDASRLASGLYLYRLETGTSSLVKKLMLLK